MYFVTLYINSIIFSRCKQPPLLSKRPLDQIGPSGFWLQTGPMASPGLFEAPAFKKSDLSFEKRFTFCNFVVQNPFIRGVTDMISGRIIRPKYRIIRYSVSGRIYYLSCRIWPDMIFWYSHTPYVSTYFMDGS